ncbi:protein takeout-like isoform X2 [Daktulosphaira vitifoliae]|uniref:protein takeout-like isoform X2 n=1 Tax=Daktulosphaira vitifoliae TaxID=58002 RepID=UPI0021AA152F|nr:protein takeout-like isoform X2 [Daktulosphaira vitifoliae]
MLIMMTLTRLSQYQRCKLLLTTYIGKGCLRDDPSLNECVVRKGSAVISRIVQGDPKYRIPKLDPLIIPEMTIQQGTKQVGLTMRCKNCELHGLKNTKFVKANVDEKKKHVIWNFELDRCMFLGLYSVEGQVLILPIKGDGNANITVTGVTFSYEYDYKLEKKANNRDYTVITKSDLRFNATGMVLKLENLFNGDKLLGDNMNLFLNENWKDLLKEFGPTIGNALGTVMKNTLGSVSELVPYDFIFPTS